MSEAPIYKLVTGQCAGTALAKRDGKVDLGGHRARVDNDGDLQAIGWSPNPTNAADCPAAALGEVGV